MNSTITFLDLFAGAGGLSEGFIRAGFTPVAHVEIDKAACYTLRTRTAWHWLSSKGHEEVYFRYLNGFLSRHELYEQIPPKQLESVVNEEIGEDSLQRIFNKIDDRLNGKKLDLIVGGPPCQAYSLAGRSRDSNRMVGDKRNYLYKYYAEFLEHFKPRYFVFENVVGLSSAKDIDGSSYLTHMKALFESYKYSTEESVLFAGDYGVLQNRKRMILVGKRGKDSNFYPKPRKWNPRVTVNEVFKDLPSIRSGQGELGPCKLNSYRGRWLRDAGIRNESTPVTFHQARPNTEQDLEIYRITVELWNKEERRLSYNDLPEHLMSHKHRSGFLDRFKVVAADLPLSHTVVAHIAKDGHYFIHPDVKQNRSITPREAARLQTFPDDYFFESISGRPSRTPAFKQIGNAVPVLFAQKIAEELKELWK
jgi:DNA (cytosine-5)-methyltransferase 1